MKPCFSQDLRISSPIRPSSTLCRWSTERNRKGIVGTCVSGQMLFMGAMFTRDHLQRADLGLLDGVLLAAQGAVVEHLDGVPCRRRAP